MKTIFKTMMAVASLAMAFACSKEEQQGTGAVEPRGTIEVSIDGVIDGYTPEDTKASTETVVRLRWDGSETVYAYEDSTCLGSLNASIESCLSLLLDNGKGNHFWRTMSVDEWESIGERNTADKKRKCGLVTVSISENKEVTGVIPANWMGVMVLWSGTIQRIWDCPYVW